MDTKELPQICEDCPENVTCNCDPEMWKCELDKKAIREALAAATPGPWKHGPGCIYSKPDGYTVNPIVASPRNFEDGELIANAPTWLQQLLDENERLRSANDDMFQNREKWRESHMQLEQENERLQDLNKALESDNYNHNMNLEHLSAEIERLKREQVKLWECPVCGFAFDAIHTDEPDGGYTCPTCAEVELQADKAVAVAALDEIKRVTRWFGDEQDAIAIKKIVDRTLKRIESGEKG